MTTNATGAEKRTVYTYHREPPEVGGAKYVRCTYCGREVIPADPDRLIHKAGCPGADQ